MSVLVLGTAQWGGAYGITNLVGRLSDADLVEIVDTATHAGVRSVDTATGYGDAEERLRPFATSFEVTTKVRGGSDVAMAAQVGQSLADLGLNRLHGCLLHDWPSLTPGQAATAAGGLEAARAAGLVSKVGVSVYDEDDLDRAVAVFDRLDAVQIPASALDQRLGGSPALATLAHGGAEIQARSVLLQGLLAAPSATALGRHPHVLAFHELCGERGLTPLEGAMAFIRGQQWVTHVVVGATSAGELREIVAAWTRPLTEEFTYPVGSDDLDLIDPRRWA